jgi:Zn-dependent M28 family amino/carboxypeptidase
MIQEQLYNHVNTIAHVIGERNYQKYEKLMETTIYIEQQLSAIGYVTRRQEFQWENKSFYNIEAQCGGFALQDHERLLILGAHYDSIVGGPGANDNATGVAGLLVLAKMLVEHIRIGADTTTKVRFVAFPNEEPPFIRTPDMGSSHYARYLKFLHPDNVDGIIVLETIGCYSDVPNSQMFSTFLPDSIYPSTGNFVAFVSNVSSRKLLDHLSALYSIHGNKSVPFQTFTGPEILPGINSSDHWSFWQEGFQAIMVTDTGPLRYIHYHQVTDTIDQINFERFASLIEGIYESLMRLLV